MARKFGMLDFGFNNNYLPPKKPYKLRLKEVRKKAKLNQTDAAKIITTTQKQYSRWETGDYEIPLFELCMLAIYFNCKVDYLLGFTNDDSPLFTEEERLIRIKKLDIRPYFNQHGLWPIEGDEEFQKIFKAYQEESHIDNNET